MSRKSLPPHSQQTDTARTERFPRGTHELEEGGGPLREEIRRVSSGQDPAQVTSSEDAGVIVETIKKLKYIATTTTSF